MISIIIIHYGSVKLTERLINSVVENAKNISDYQILIIDNGSPEPFIKQPQIRSNVEVHRLDPGMGYGAAINYARSFVKHDKILILNNDLVFKADVPFRMAKAWDSLEKPGILGPGVFFPDGRFQVSWAYDQSLFWEWIERQTQRSMHKNGIFWYPLRRYLSRNLRKVDWVSGVAMMTTQGVFDSVLGFDKGFPFYYEDSDLCRRVRSLGLNVYYDPSIQIFHELGGAQVNTEQSAEKLLNQKRITNFKKLGHFEYYRRYRPRWEQWALSIIYRLRRK